MRPKQHFSSIPTSLLIIFTFLVLFYGEGGVLFAVDDKKPKSSDEKKKEKKITHEVEVVAKRVPEDRFKTDRSVAVMSESALQEQSPRTVPEAIYDSPGAFVQHTNMGGGSPIIRGMIGPQLLIMVDGVRFNNSTYRTGPGQYLNLIDPLSAERIEILRGPGSVLYGSDAMGGVIQVNTLGASTGFSRDADATHGNEGFRFSGNLLSRYHSANNGGSHHGHFKRSKNDFTVIGGLGYKKFNDLEGGKGVGTQPFVGYDHTSAIGKMVQRFSKGAFKDWSFTVGYLYSRIDDAGRTDKLYDKNSLQVYDNTDHLVYGRLHMTFPGFSSEAKLTVSYQDFFERKDNSTVKDDYKTITKTTRDEVSAATLGLDLNMTTRLKPRGLRLHYGAMWYKDTVNSDRFKQNAGEDWNSSSEQSYPDGSSYSNYGAYGFLEWDVLHLDNGGYFRLGGGYRLHGMSAQVPAKGNLPEVDFSHTGHVFLMSAQYMHREDLNVSFTFSQGFRSPNLQESVMLGDTGKFFHIPNYNLEPEQSNTMELLTRWRTGSLILSWSGYVSFLENLIKREATTWMGQSEIDGKDVVFNVNAGKGILWGTEGSFLLGISGNLSLSGHLTYTWGEEKVDNGPNIPLTRIPPLFGQFKIRYDQLRIGRWNGFVETYIRAATKQDRLSKEDIKDVRIPPGGTPGWMTLNVRAGVALFEHVRLCIGLNNIFNQRYKYHASGIYNPGTNAVLTLEVF